MTLCQCPPGPVPLTHPGRAPPTRGAVCRWPKPDSVVGSELLRLAPHRIDVTVCTDGAEALFRAGLVRPDLVLVSADIELVHAERVIELNGTVSW